MRYIRSHWDTIMTISNDGKKLLNDIFSASFKSPNGMDALRFRADNEQFISELDQLEHLGYIERKNDRYFIKPLALSQLAKESPDACSILHICSLVFALLRGTYKDNPGQKITVSDISRNTNLPEDDVRAGLRIIIQTELSFKHQFWEATQTISLERARTLHPRKAFSNTNRLKTFYRRYKSGQRQETANTANPRNLPT